MTRYPSNYSLVTAATEYPVSLADAKLHLRVDIDEDDDLITALIGAATEHVEAATGRALVTRTVDFYAPSFPCNSGEIELPLSPVSSVTNLIFTDSAATAHTWTVSGTNLLNELGTINAHVDLVNAPPRLVLAYSQVWPSNVLKTANALKVRFVAGYGAATTVPLWAKQAMLLLIGTWYMQRESITIDQRESLIVPHTVDLLLAPNKVWSFA